MNKRKTHLWITDNFDKINRYAGKWIAIGPEGILATSEDFDTVFEEAERKGETNPVVFKVPSGTRRKVVSGKWT